MSTHDAETTVSARQLLPGQRAELTIFDLARNTSTILLTSESTLFEAPNWHPHGDWIVVNANGRLYRIPATSGARLDPITSPDLPPVNNDHLVSPDGQWHYVSATDGHLYRLPWEGGSAERMTTDKQPERRFRHFLHGISPDGGTVAYVGTEAIGDEEWAQRALWLLDLHSGAERLVGDGFSPADGPEFSPDAEFLYYNSEAESTRPAHAQLFRIRLRDDSVERLTSDERVNWFPHVSPDGRWLSYLSYPPGTLGHPADLPVELRLIDLANRSPTSLVALPGGQGTVNVNSWSPDSTRFGYVAYPIDDQDQ